MKIEYNNPMVVMAAAIHQWKTHNTSQKPGIMSWPPQHMRSNPPSATTSPRNHYNPKLKTNPR
jgi:hypothetical protein